MTKLIALALLVAALATAWTLSEGDSSPDTGLPSGGGRSDIIGAEVPAVGASPAVSAEGSLSRDTGSPKASEVGWPESVVSGWAPDPDEFKGASMRLGRLLGCSRIESAEMLRLFVTEEAWTKMALALSEDETQLRSVSENLNGQVFTHAVPMANNPTNPGLRTDQRVPPGSISIDMLVGDDGRPVKKRFAVDPLNSSEAIAKLWLKRESLRNGLRSRLERILQDQ